jgi:hypothetical protein
MVVLVLVKIEVLRTSCAEAPSIGNMSRILERNLVRIVGWRSNGSHVELVVGSS